MIKLDKNYRIEEDAHSWNLVYEGKGPVNPKTGKPKKLYDISYHANLKQALSTYLDKSLKGSTELQGVLARLSEVEQRIQSL